MSFDSCEAQRDSDAPSTVLLRGAVPPHLCKFPSTSALWASFYFRFMTLNPAQGANTSVTSVIYFIKLIFFPAKIHAIERNYRNSYFFPIVCQ